MRVQYLDSFGMFNELQFITYRTKVTKGRATHKTNCDKNKIPIPLMLAVLFTLQITHVEHTKFTRAFGI